MNLKKIKQSNISKNYFNTIIFIFIIFLYSYLFYSIINSQYSGDDNWNAQISGQLIEENISILRRINNEWIGWLTGAGSIRITYYYIIYPLFHFIDNINVIKTISLVNIILNGFLISYFVNLITKNKNLTLLTPIIFALFIQYKFWHDPILGFPSYMMPLILNFLMISIIYFYKNFYHEDRYYKWLSVICYFFILFMYEISIYFILIFVYFYIWLKKDSYISLKNLFKDLKPFFIVALIHLSITIFYRLIYIPIFREYNSYPAGIPNFNYLIDAFFYQLLGSMPTSFYFNVTKNLGYVSSINEITIVILITLIFIFSTNLFLFLKKNNNNNDTKYQKFFFSLFVIIGIPSSIITAMSGHGKEIIELGKGYTYIPVYLQYVGNIFLIISFLYLLKKIKNYFLYSILSLILSVMIVYGIYINQINNDVVLSQIKNPGRELIYSSFNSGLFDSLDNNDYLIREFKYPSDYKRNYMSYLEKNIHTTDLYDPESTKIFLKGIKEEVGSRMIWDNKNNEITVNVENITNFNIWFSIYGFFDNDKEDGVYYLLNVNEIVINSENEILRIYGNYGKSFNSKSKVITKFENLNLDLLKLVYFNDSYVFDEYTPFNSL